MNIYSLAVGSLYRTVQGEIYKLVSVIGDQVNALNSEGNMVIHHIQDYLEDMTYGVGTENVETNVTQEAVVDVPVNVVDEKAAENVPVETPAVEVEDTPVAVDKETNNVAE
jgi:hypothetical protein